MTQGKYQRTEGTSFLGTKYRTFTCVKCKTKYEDIGLNKDRKCPPCDNMTFEDFMDSKMDYSKSFDECFRDSAKAVREWNDKSKS